ncbi:hypothetical protein Tsubulata_029251 [Turnera subulata]|uniref:DUF4283 domain-containing protein n=1 Tax=Turnera subulata TaxID=218843 RepID=A0A9Q0G604_9ROSI|nr:hypothetical protein Tsubulata_029251 [Turnera subulata]
MGRNREECSIVFTTSEEAGLKFSRLVLLGKVEADDRVLRIEAIKTLVVSRSQVNSVKVRTTDRENIFLFIFESEEDKQRVLQEAFSSAFKNIIFKEWPHDKALKDINFAKGPACWIQVHGLPPNQMTKENAKKIGAMFAGLVEFDHGDLSGDVLCSNGYMRLKVDVWADEPFRKGFLNRKPNGESYWVEFKPEKV